MTTENSMVPVTTTVHPIAERQAGSMIASWQSQASSILTSLQTDTPQGKEDFFKCNGTAKRLLKHCVGQPIAVRDWFIHEVQLTDQEDGETFPALRLVLVEDNGDTISTTSESVIRGWRHVVSMFGQRTFDPPVVIIVSAHKARTAGEYLQIDSAGLKNTGAISKKK